MNGSGGGGSEPVTWIVLHWQRCTVAPGAVAMAAAAAAAVESAAPRMQKIVGRRLLPLPLLLRPVHRATSAKNEGLVGGGQWMWRSLALPPACRRFDQFQLPSPLAAPSVGASVPFFPWASSFFPLALPSPLLLFSFFLLFPVLLAFLSASSRSLAGPAHWRRAQQNGERQRYE